MTNNVVKMLEKTASIVSQQAAMEQSLVMLDHGTRMFDVKAGWQSRAIQKDPSVTCCETVMELEAAVKDENVKVIFMSFRAMIMPSDIEKIVKRNGATKTLFKEVVE